MTSHHQFVFRQNPKSHIPFSPIEGSTSMAGFQPPSPISNSLCLCLLPLHSTFRSNSEQVIIITSNFLFIIVSQFYIPIFVVGNSEEWLLLHIRFATAIVFLMILFVALFVKLCKCGRKRYRTSVYLWIYELTEALA